MNNELEVVKTFKDEVGGISQALAVKIDTTLPTLSDGVIKMKKEFDKALNLPVGKKSTKVIHELRMRFVKVRTGSDKNRKKLNKEHAQAIDINNDNHKLLISVTVPMEEVLEKAEKYEENLEKAVVEKLQAERALELLKLDPEMDVPKSLGSLPLEMYKPLYDGVKLGCKERAAEALRIQEEEAAQELIKKLNHDRIYMCSRLVDFIPGYNFMVNNSKFGVLSEDSYTKLVSMAKDRRSKHEEAQVEVQRKLAEQTEENAYTDNKAFDDELLLTKKADDYGSKLVKSGFRKMRNGNYEKESFQIFGSTLRINTDKEFKKSVKQVNDSIVKKKESELKELLLLEIEAREFNTELDKKAADKLQTEKAEAAALAPDKDKMKKFADDIASFITNNTPLLNNVDYMNMLNQSVGRLNTELDVLRCVSDS